MVRLVRSGGGVRIGAVLLVLVSAAPVRAQTRLYLLFAGDTVACRTTDCEPPRVLQIDVDGRRIVADTPVLHARENATPPVVTPDGRYLAWSGTEDRIKVPSYLSAFDTATRTQIPLVRTSAAGNSGIVFADPAAVRLFTQFEFGSPITVAEPQGFRGLPLPCTSGSLQAISGDGSRLFVRCPLTPAGVVVVLDSGTGAELGRVPAFGPYPGGISLASNDDGREVYAVASVSPAAYALRRVDVATGALLAERSIGSPSSEIAFDRRTQRVYLAVGDIANNVTALDVYDSSTLALIHRVPSPLLQSARAVIVPDPERDAAYVAWSQPSPASSGSRTMIALLDTATLATVAEATLANDTRFLGMVQGPRPPRAIGLSASVIGSTVTLEWMNATGRSLPTGLVVEAGSAPGLSNLAVLQLAAAQTRLTVPNVARGAYYVRVRSVNGTGPGEASNEVLVTVP